MQLATAEEDLRRRASQLADWLGRTERIRDNKRKKFIRHLRQLNLEDWEAWSCADGSWNASYKDFLQNLKDHHTFAENYIEEVTKKCATHQKAAIELFRSFGPLGISLNFVSPDLSRAVKRSNKFDLTGKKTRKMTRGLGRVLLRSNTKSSPFAMLNEVEVKVDGRLPVQLVTAITPNTVHQLCVFEALVLNDAIIDQVHFQLNSNYWDDGHTLHVVAQATDSVNRKVFRHRDRLFRATINAPIRAVLSAGTLSSTLPTYSADWA
ncbi:hypothetical protein RQN30_06915 [Arcanobacterium hippocoleae]